MQQVKTYPHTRDVTRLWEIGNSIVSRRFFLDIARVQHSTPNQINLDTASSGEQKHSTFNCALLKKSYLEGLQLLVGSCALVGHNEALTLLINLDQLERDRLANELLTRGGLLTERRTSVLEVMVVWMSACRPRNELK